MTCADIESWRPVKPNAWVQEERRFATLQERLNELVLACDAAIALPGGPGTLTEIALTWNLMIVNSMPPKPLILTGRRLEVCTWNRFSIHSKSTSRRTSATCCNLRQIFRRQLLC